MTLPAHYVTTPCRGCGRPVIFVTARNLKGEWVKVPLDPSAPVYVREHDGEGGAVWAQDSSKELLVSHFSTCSRANDFSGSNRPKAGGGS